MDEIKNRGVLTAPRLPSQYLFGGISPISLPDRTVSDWRQFLPDSEAQSDRIMDTMACLTFSGLHCIEAQVNADIQNGKYPKASIDYFKNAGYMKNGKFKCSARYSAKMNGTSWFGNYVAVVADGFRKDGLLPDLDYPFDQTMTFQEFYTNPTPQMIAKAKQIYNYITIQHQELTTVPQILQALHTAPVQVCTAVCPGWDSGNVVGACIGNPQHATVVYGFDPITGHYKDFDQYTPFFQDLANDYQFLVMMQFIAQPSIPVFKTMKIGSTGSDVQALQEDLKKLGYFPVSQVTTQYFGAITFAAVEKFQKENELHVDGIFGPASNDALVSLKKKLS